MVQTNQLEPSLTDLILNPKSKKIARPPNAFMLFAREHRKSLAMKYPTHNNKNISSLLGECWRSVDEATKKEYYKKAKMLEELHKQRYPGYVYSPRIARMQKMARKKKNPDKCCDNNESNDNEASLKPVGTDSACNHGNEKCDEWNDNNSEKKKSSPGYVPNNPQYFSDPEHGTQPELLCNAERNTSSIASQGYAYPGCPPPPWTIPPVESIAVPCSGRCPDECMTRSDLYTENYYPKTIKSEMYDYGPWNRYSDYPYESPVNSTWGSCVAGCQGECSTIHSSDEYSSYSHFPSSQHLDLKSPYYHYNSTAPYRNSSYPYSYGPYRDSPMPYRSRRYIPCKNFPPKAPPSYFCKSMDYFHNQYQHHSRFPYSPQPIDYPPIHETVCSSDYPPEVYDSRSFHVEERTESNDTAHSAQYEEVEQVNNESDGNEILNVVDVESEESNILTEEVVELTNPELGQVVHDVIVM
ncbi:transcription factor Sox-7-like [Argiope bruennichi]|uniref:transcription factor Sox-7-like n=1 Tax=Argiope bruennichi TaxID=94029 RepID=UPI0024958262|nr:transcription factor Sox-7-like [Argiope bruennichi]